MLGNDVVRIEPDDPLARVGLYYIGVLGVKDSRFVIDAVLEQQRVDAPGLPPRRQEQGFMLLRRELESSLSRLRTVASGASLLGHLPRELERGGHMQADVEAAGERVATRLADAVQESRGEPRHNAQRQLHRAIGRDPRPKLAKAEITGTREEKADEVRWQPPPGFGWDDFPDGTRLVQAERDYRLTKVELEEALEERLAGLAVERPLKYAIRMRALTAVDPTSTLSHPSTLRHSSAVIEADYYKSRSMSSLPRAETAPEESKGHARSPELRSYRPTTSPATG